MQNKRKRDNKKDTDIHVVVKCKKLSYIFVVDVILETIRTLSDTGVIERPPYLYFFHFRNSSNMIHVLAFIFADAPSRQICISANRKTVVQ